MSEEPKSFWNRPVRGVKFVALWLALLIGVALLTVAVSTAMQTMPPRWEFSDTVALFVFSAISSAILLGLWAFVRRLYRQGGVQKIVFVFACIATAIGLFYAEENWRGRSAWQKYRREWEAKGEKFDLKDFVPPPVPDEKNFAMTPVMVSGYGFILTRDGKVIPSEQRATNWVYRLRFNLGDDGSFTNGTGNWAKGTMSDLKIWQAHYRELAAKTNLFAVPAVPQSPAQDVLLALGKYDATVEELRQAAQLPECRFPLNYDEENAAMIFLPHLAALKSCSRLLQLRAIAEIENAQGDKALADVLLTLRLSEFVRTEPTVIDLLVRIAMTDIVLQPIYEGLAKHAWTDAQLAALDAELARVDFLTDNNFAMRGERAFAANIIDYVSRKDRWHRYEDLTSVAHDFEGKETKAEPELEKMFYHAGFWLMPRGWFEQNKLFIARLHEQKILPMVEPENHLVLPQKTGELSYLVNGSASAFDFFARLIIPALPNAVKKSAREQVAVDLARTAIALERFHLAHRNFPESLDALTPQFVEKVPRDVIGGQPLKYRRTDENFVLYSVGWNETDDGGEVGFTKGSGTALDSSRGDWVWRYPKK